MKVFRKYLITLLVESLAVFAILWAKDIFDQTTLVSIFHILSDAFFAVGVVATCVGLLIFSTNEGTFDMLVYGVKTFLSFFRVNSKKKYDTFYDYRESRAGKKLQFGFLVICGLVFLAVAFVMYYFYRRYS